VLSREAVTPARESVDRRSRDELISRGASAARPRATPARRGMPDELGGIRVIRDRHADTCSVAADSAESARKWEAERVRASSVFSRETRERPIDPLIAILPPAMAGTFANDGMFLDARNCQSSRVCSFLERTH